MQTSYTTNPPTGRLGMLADSRMVKTVLSRLASSIIVAGLGVFRVPGYGQPGSHLADPGQVFQVVTAPDAAADVDAFITAHASAAIQLALSGTDLNGVVGQASISPARKVTLVLSNHADWDATTAVLTYRDQDDVERTENLAIPDNGNTTLTSTGRASRVVSLVIPAQSGAAGSFTLGVAALTAGLTAADFEGVAMYDAAKVPASSVAEFGVGDTVPVLGRGPVWVTTEDTATAGASAFVRVSGAGTLGAFRTDADGGAAVSISGRFTRDSAPGGLNILELL